MNLSCILFGMIFIVTGALFADGRLHERLKGWQQMSAKEREEVDILPLCRNIGGMIAFCGMIFLAAGLSVGFLKHVFVWAMIIWFVLSGIDIWYIGKSGRYMHK